MAGELTTRNAVWKDTRIAKKIEALKVESRRVKTAAAAPETALARGFMKSSRQRLYQARQGKRGLYVLQRGAKGHPVRRLQNALKAAGVYGQAVDGTYSSDVEAAVRDYQKRQDLTPDGVAGPATLERLGLY